MPYDQTYVASIRGQADKATGWLDDPLSPVPITSNRQPIAVQNNLPSTAASDRNDNFRQTAKQPGQIVETFLSGIQAPKGQTETYKNQNPNPNPTSRQSMNPSSKDHSSAMTLKNPSVVEVYEVDTVTTNGSDRMRVRMDKRSTNVSSASSSSSREENDDDDKDTCDVLSFSTLFPCMVKSLRGFMRDLVSPDRQPDDQDTLEWLFRNNRVYYILTFMILVIITSIGIHSLCGSDSQHVVQLFCIFVVAFLVYLALPRTHGQTELQKITSLFILSVVVWGLVYKVKH
jgi:uncharacterized membrane protein YtjA (UPF0391 family)